MQRLLIIALLLVIGQLPAHAEDHAVGARIGLLGLGVEYAYRVSDRISVRGGLNGSGTDFQEFESGIQYDFDLDFDSISIGVDVHPLKGAFRVSGGFLSNDSGLSASSLAALTYDVGGTTYSGAAVGTLRGRIGFDSTAPFIGVGFDWLRDKRVGLALDMGVLDQGAPRVTLTASGPIASDPGFAQDLATEQLELQQELDDFDVYPYAMFGIVVRF